MKGTGVTRQHFSSTDDSPEFYWLTILIQDVIMTCNRDLSFNCEADYSIKLNSFFYHWAQLGLSGSYYSACKTKKV